MSGPTIIVPAEHQARIRQEGPRVLLLLDGKLIANMDHGSAEALGRALIGKARKAADVAALERGIVSREQFGTPTIIRRGG